MFIILIATCPNLKLTLTQLSSSQSFSGKQSAISLFLKLCRLNIRLRLSVTEMLLNLENIQNPRQNWSKVSV